jgi:hypothetical protein
VYGKCYEYDEATVTKTRNSIQANKKQKQIREMKNISQHEEERKNSL